MPKHAKDRGPVRTTSGKVGRLLYWPIPGSVRRSGLKSSGARAKILLSSGAVVSVDCSEVVPVRAVDTTGTIITRD